MQGAEVPKLLAARLSDKHLMKLYVNKVFITAVQKYGDLTSSCCLTDTIINYRLHGRLQSAECFHISNDSGHHPGKIGRIFKCFPTSRKLTSMVPESCVTGSRSHR